MSKKEIGLIIKFPEKQCSHEEKIYMRAKYICKLIEWKQARDLKKSNG